MFLHRYFSRRLTLIIGLLGCSTVAISSDFTEFDFWVPRKDDRRRTELHKLMDACTAPRKVLQAIKAESDFRTRPVKAPEAPSSYSVDQPFSEGERPLALEKTHLGRPMKHISRVLNALRATQCIERLGLEHVSVPKKYIYDDKNRQRVFVEYIHSVDNTLLTKEEVQELATFAETTGYWDWGYKLGWGLKRSNLVRDSATGNIIVVDLEDKSFVNPGDKKIECLYGLGRDMMTPDAYQWLVDRKLQLLGANARCNEPLPTAKECQGIDLDTATQEWILLIKEREQAEQARLQQLWCERNPEK